MQSARSTLIGHNQARPFDHHKTQVVCSKGVWMAARPRKDENAFGYARPSEPAKFGVAHAFIPAKNRHL
jgi:hypothetical protein